MNKRTLQRAIGVSNGKSLIVQNDCASACIIQEIGPRGGVKYIVESDTSHGREFKTAEKALGFALRELADMMDGSPNR